MSHWNLLWFVHISIVLYLKENSKKYKISFQRNSYLELRKSGFWALRLGGWLKHGIENTMVKSIQYLHFLVNCFQNPCKRITADWSKPPFWKQCSVPDKRRVSGQKPDGYLSQHWQKGKSFCSVFLVWIFITRKHSEVSNFKHL